jgi:uncharacterized phage protein (TIGR02220 family)
MARIRTIKPEFWTDAKIGSLSFLERLLFIGMWNFADDEGLINANPLFLKSQIFPYDERLKISEVQKALVHFDSLKMVYLYKINNQPYAWIIKFRSYQRIDKPQKPLCPTPSIQNSEFALSVFKRDNFTCHLCKEETNLQDELNIVNSRRPSLDHIIAKSKNGTNYPSNLVTACISCNKSRGNNDLVPFVEYSENNLGIFQGGLEKEKEKEKEKEQGKEGKGRDIYSEAISYLNLKTGAFYKDTTPKTRELIDSRVKEGFTLEDFKKVIDNMTGKWGLDPKMKQFLRPHTLFGTKFEGYLNTKVSLSDRGIVSPTTERNLEVLDQWVKDKEAQDAGL